MRRVRTIAVLLLIAAAIAAAFFAARRAPRSAEAPLRVWACGDGWKIQPDTPVRRDPVFDHGMIRLAAGRQEYVAFQVVVRAGSQPVRQLALRVAPLRREGGGSLSGDNFDLFSQHLLHVTLPSQNGPGKPVPGARAGWFPAQLVPLSRLAHGTRDRAGDWFELQNGAAQHRNVAVWIDLYVPEEQAPGKYRGAIEVLAGGKSLQALPLELTVWRFALPRETHFKTYCEASTDDLRWAFGYRDIDEPSFRALEDRFFQMAHQHRINFNLNSTATAEDELAHRYRSYLDGSAFTARAGKGAGLNLWMVGLEREGVDGDSNDSVTQFIRNIAALQRENKWPAAFACYVLDEPESDDDFRRAATRCAWVHAAGGGTMATYLTTPDWQKMPPGAINVWGELKPEDIPGREAAGQKVWAVNADYTTGPFVDTAAIAGRSLIWMGWRLGLDAWHFWSCCYWIDRQNRPAPGGGSLTPRGIDEDPPRYLTDTWNDPLTFDQSRKPASKHKRGIRLNGDGVLFYPGTPTGVNGPLASFPLKSLRRGLQDYEYLWLLRQRGIDTSAIVQRLVPRAGEWERDPAAWDAARLELGRMLDEAEGK